MDQAQNELNNELKKQRSFHSNVVQEKTQDLNILNGIIENYQKLMKKIQDENQFLLEESKKIEDKKNAALKTIMAYQNNIDVLLNKNLEIKQKIFNQASKSIDEISETAKNTLDQINQTSKPMPSENITLFQRKQLMQEERERARLEEYSSKPQQQPFPKNFDSENFPEVEMRSDNYNIIQKNANMAQVNMQMSPPFNNENNNFKQNTQMTLNPSTVDEKNNFSNAYNEPFVLQKNEERGFVQEQLNNQAKQMNYQSENNQSNFIAATPPRNLENGPTIVSKSNNASPQKSIKELNLNNNKAQINKSSEFTKNIGYFV